MQSWNRVLLQACERHANMRVCDWASEVRDDWYLPDQIHQRRRRQRARQSLGHGPSRSPSRKIGHRPETA